MQIGYHAAVRIIVDFGDVTKSDAPWTSASMSGRQAQHWYLPGSVNLARVYRPLCTQASFLAVLDQRVTRLLLQCPLELFSPLTNSQHSMYCFRDMVKFGEIIGALRTIGSGYCWDLLSWESSASSWVVSVLVADGVQTSGVGLGKSFSKRTWSWGSMYLPRSVGISFFPSWCILFGSLM